MRVKAALVCWRMIAAPIGVQAMKRVSLLLVCSALLGLPAVQADDAVLTDGGYATRPGGARPAVAVS